MSSAVTASMNLTNSTDTMETAVPYKTEATADMHLYYQVKIIIVRFIVVKLTILIRPYLLQIHRITPVKLTKLAMDFFHPFSMKTIYS